MKGFNVAENGGGSYRPLAILRWVMVIIFVSFGMQKFTLQSAQGIAQFITNSPFISRLSVFGLRGEAYFLGVSEFVIAALLAAGAFSPIFVRRRLAHGRGDLRDHMVVLLHDAGGGQMEPLIRSNGVEFNRRIPVQGYRLAQCLRRVVSRVVAAIGCSAAHQLSVRPPLTAGRGRSRRPRHDASCSSLGR